MVEVVVVVAVVVVVVVVTVMGAKGPYPGDKFAAGCVWSCGAASQ